MYLPGRRTLFPLAALERKNHISCITPGFSCCLRSQQRLRGRLSLSNGVRMSFPTNAAVQLTFSVSCKFDSGLFWRSAPLAQAPLASTPRRSNGCLTPPQTTGVVRARDTPVYFRRPSRTKHHPEPRERWQQIGICVTLEHADSTSNLSICSCMVREPLHPAGRSTDWGPGHSQPKWYIVAPRSKT